MRQHDGAEKKPGSGFPSGSEDRSGFCWQHSCCPHQTTPLLCLHKRNVRCCLIVCITTPSCMCSISCFGHHLHQMKIKSKWRATKLTVFAQIQWSKIWWNCLFYFLIEKCKTSPRPPPITCIQVFHKPGENTGYVHTHHCSGTHWHPNQQLRDNIVPCQ